MKRINLLDKHTINQIAAGEVIERPASVVKELVENSIDAGSTQIEISITNDCRNIRVADNGSGIHPDDIELAFVKHATSKIKDDKDLYDIHSLGFRGEALASIISISRLSAFSRTKDYDYGYRIDCEHSEVKKSQMGCAIGTVMEVKDLFYNLPVRQKFLKNPSTEFSYIAEISQLIALSNPNVSIILKNNNSEYFRTSGSGDLKTTICEIYTNSFLDKLKVVNKTDLLSDLRVSGFAATPDFSRSSRKSIITFLNGRVVKCQILSKAIETAYKSMLPIKRYPFVVINLEIPTSDVDINVHPQKKEVRYKSTNQVFQFVMSAVASAISSRVVQEFEQTQNNIVPMFGAVKSTEEDDVVYVSEETIQNKFFEVEDTFKSFARTVEEPSFAKTDVNYTQFETNTEQYKQKDYRIIGQYKNTYILIEYQDGLEIVDQHIADERYRFEMLMNEDHPESQVLLFSDKISIDSYESGLIQEKLPELEKIGYGIEFVNEKEIIFKKIPQVVAHIGVKELFDDIIKTLKNSSVRSFYENMITSISCKSSIKAGQELNMWQIEELIARWKTTQNPYTCPHGRPICKKFKHNDIAGFFLRNE